MIYVKQPYKPSWHIQSNLWEPERFSIFINKFNWYCLNTKRSWAREHFSKSSLSLEKHLLFYRNKQKCTKNYLDRAIIFANFIDILCLAIYSVFTAVYVYCQVSGDCLWHSCNYNMLIAEISWFNHIYQKTNGKSENIYCTYTFKNPEMQKSAHSHACGVEQRYSFRMSIVHWIVCIYPFQWHSNNCDSHNLLDMCINMQGRSIDFIFIQPHITSTTRH